MALPLLLMLALVLASTAETSYPRCLKDVKEVEPKRYLLSQDQTTLSLVLQTSSRPAHRLFSQAFAIFLREVLGYAYVSLSSEDDKYNATNAVRNLLHKGSTLVPESMMNLEVLLPPDQDLQSHTLGNRVEDCGSTGPVGRFGWFVPESLVKPSKSTTEPPPDHWRVFTRPEWAKRFALDPNPYKDIFARDPDTKQYYCTEEYCENGLHTPPQCRDNPDLCTLLLADFPDYSGFVVQQIASLDLLVRVLWVGPNLQQLTEALTDKQSANFTVVTLSWHPSLLTSARNYTSISFPACEPHLNTGSPQTWPCSKLSLHRMVKAVWGSLREGARQAYESIHRFSVTTAHYQEMLQRYAKAGPTRDQQLEALACEWMKDNWKLWNHWVPKTDEERTELYIGGIFPITGNTYTAKGIVAAASMAISAVNANSTVLRDYTLKLSAFNGQCKADYVMMSFIEYIRHRNFNRLVGILGPACSDTVEPLAGVSRHYRTVIISYSAEGSSFSDRAKYPYFFRTIGENKQYKFVYLELLRRLKWKRVAALTEDGQKYTEYISHMQDLLHINGISFITNRKFPRDREALAMSQYLEDLKSKSARIIIADVYDDAARSVMCEAYKLGMTGRQGYVWFLPLWLSPHWYNTDHFNVDQNENIKCTTSQMIEAINGHLALTHAYFAPDDTIMQEQVTVGKWRKKYEERCRRQNWTESNYAGYAYDAVWTYAFALEKLLQENQSYVADLHSGDATESYVRHLSNTDFTGVSGHIRFLNGPSRVSVINVVQWLNNVTHIVGSFYPKVNESKGEIVGGKLELNVSAIHWMSADGEMPGDGTEPPPSCILDPLARLLNQSCEAAIVVANLIGFTIIGLLLFLGFVLVKRRYERMTQKYMKSIGIDLLPTPTLASLDKWEIARDCVVINRKLGEGAFGTVYGGEAYFPEKGWMAVAVKTLKLGSTTEVKLDFLSEAEVMKRLEHQNVVRLLGVCTKNEPVYTIMEFMLYGDLKTFLLARRHLVNERRPEEKDEISCKKLTNMALDIARALSYLAELKFVHRDVACRNCMVNANRIVKLGDFGMTRAMYESDYYKFNRKGMLPVRWMAPESLGLGIFTPQSDIWSFGVLLYEIITFGSFPFQGMSNTQVLEYVKNGNTLTVPRGLKPQLMDLLKSCWNLDHKKRPAASEIVEFLANNPRLIEPTLDVPLASVQMEDTGQFDLQLPEKSRKCSISLKSRHRSLSGGSSHAATTPNSPTSPEPGVKLARSATAHDVLQQSIPILPAPPGNTRHQQGPPFQISADMEPLLPLNALVADVSAARGSNRSVTVPMWSSPPLGQVNRTECAGAGLVHENGGPSLGSPSRRASGTVSVAKYMGYQPGPRQRRGSEDPDLQATSIL